uniref:Reverse transcriptase zinc-binding domain-containing protein n=1 Tax=Davidia involucrata TaxID=16924 RepID=A0A5B7CH51_DAVIN
MNILPTGTRLAERKIPVDYGCCLCGGRAETSLHLFLHCPWTQLVWEHSKISLPREKCFIDCRHMLEFICNEMDGDDIDVCCVMLWLIWGHRNAVRHGNKGRDPLQIHLSAKSYVRDFRDAQQQLDVEVHVQVSVSPSIWSPHSVGFFKLNTDDSWDPSERTGGIGGVIRDCRGKVIGGFAKPFKPLLFSGFCRSNCRLPWSVICSRCRYSGCYS